MRLDRSNFKRELREIEAIRLILHVCVSEARFPTEAINIFVSQMSTADFPKRLPEKLKLIRERLAMTPDQLAAFVGAKSGAEVRE